MSLLGKIFSSKKGSKHESFFGLDISDSSLKLVMLKAGKNGLMVHGMSSQHLVDGIVFRGRVQSIQKLSDALIHAMQHAVPNAVPGMNVVLSFPDQLYFSHCSYKNVDIPSYSTVLAKASKIIPIEAKSMALDWRELKGLKTKQVRPIWIGATDQTYLHEYHEVCRRAGCHLQIVEPEAESLSRALLSHDQQNTTALIIDIGEQSTKFILYSHGVVAYTSSIPFAGRHITLALASALNITPTDAEEMKRRFGLTEQTEHPNLMSALTRIIKPIHNNVDKTLAFAKQVIEKPKAVPIIVTGGGALLPGFKVYLGKILNQNVQFNDPWEMNRVTLGAEAQKQADFHPIMYSTVVGVALRAAVEDPYITGSNFLKHIPQSDTRGEEHQFVKTGKTPAK